MRQRKFKSFVLGSKTPKIKQLLKSAYYGVRFYSIPSAIRRRKLLERNDVKLHLGSGSVRIPGWINVDAQITSSVDIADDVSTLRKFHKNCACSIYACHVLEHFSHKEIPLILRRWYDVLRPDGELRISVPDVDRIVRIYIDNWDHFQTEPNTPWIGLIWGGS